MNTKELARRIRVHAVHMTNQAGSSHIGSVLSMADILAVLYGKVLKKNPSDARWVDRDRFILSKGHAGAGVYAALAETGYFSVELLKEYCQNGGSLSGHVSHKNVPGVELSTGSLGHGLSIGIGMAMSAKLDGRNYRTYVLISDGECDEGSNWEGILFGPHHELGNLMVIVDHNKLQSYGSVKEVLGLDSLLEKFRSFGWEAIDVDGHDHESLARALDFTPGLSARPKCIVAHTTKGKGVSFMENQLVWHYRTPKGDDYVNALRELNHA